MESTYKLVWSDNALRNLKSIISYLEDVWTDKEIRKFVQLLNRQLSLIQTNPYLFSLSPKSINLRKAVLSKQISVYYQIEPDHVRLISLFDNRQNPNKIELKNK
jgi:plasmid stabilization system protein ParE